MITTVYLSNGVGGRCAVWLSAVFSFECAGEYESELVGEICGARRWG